MYVSTNILLKYWVFETMSCNVLGIYLGLLNIYRFSGTKNVIFNHKEILYYLYGTTEGTRGQNKSVLDGLSTLVDMGLIQVYNSKYFLLDTSIFDVGDSYYIQLPHDSYCELKGNPTLLRHFLFILKSRSTKITVGGKIGIISTMPVSYFAEAEQVTESTIYRYNAELEAKNLIYIRRCKYDPSDNSRECNVYGLYEHRDLIDSYVGHYSGDESEANFRRRVAAKYNRYKADPTCYDGEELEVFKAELNKYNAQMVELGKKQPDYLKRIKLLD